MQAPTADYPFHVKFELDMKFDYLYWLTIKVNDIPVGHICRNLNVDDDYALMIYDLDESNHVWKNAKRLNIVHRGAYSTINDAKSAFLDSPCAFYEKTVPDDVDWSPSGTIRHKCTVG
jgi:hypothetical protein